MTHQTRPSSLSTLCPTNAPRTHALARDARARRRRVPALATCAAMLCAASLCANATKARKPRAPKTASAPSTAQILAPSAATVPDALPPDRLVYRCGNSYSAHPCADPAAKPLAVADARSDAQRRQSDDLVARDKRLAAWYEAGRREREKPASTATAGRRASAAVECVSNTMMTCVPKKPRTRLVLSTAAPSPAAGKAR